MQSEGDPASIGTALRVLVVEDEMMVALLMEAMLSELGHTLIGPVGRLGPAIEMAREVAVDVAILDVNLNGEDVYPVAEALNQRGIPFVFSTGYGNRGVRTPFRDRPTLQKPFLLDALRRALAAACSGGTALASA